jgi:UDP-3-O-[3-hydroxymyristoyl] glucosamine N-acyltransferase
MEFTTKEKALLRNAGVNLAKEGESYHRHINPNGRKGALVHNDAEVGEGVFLGPKAVVREHTHVRAGAQLHGAALFGPYAETQGIVVVKGGVQVAGEKDHPTRLIASTVTGKGTKLFSVQLVHSKASAGVVIRQSGMNHSFASGQDTLLEKSFMFDGATITRGAQAINAEISNGALLTDRSKALADAVISGKGTVVRNAFVAHGSSVTRGAQVNSASLNDRSWVHGPQAFVRHATLLHTEVNNSEVDQLLKIRGGLIDDNRHAFRRSSRVEKLAKNPPRERILAR